MNKKLFLLLLLVVAAIGSYAQPIKFALVTDTHVGNATGADDLENTVKDINSNPEIEFVIVSGDVTEFGADEELKLAKNILDQLQKPWYAIPGNHDTNWSESGSNSFNRIFGSGTFSFEHKGFVFLGTGSGPNMRMGPGQIPREDIVWLHQQLKTVGNKPIVYVNHYPQDSSLNNWYSAIDLLKQHQIKFMICGHGHTNRLYHSEGINNVMCRSNLRAKDTVGGYNIVSLDNQKVWFEEKRPFQSAPRKWLELSLEHVGNWDKKAYKRPDYSINSRQTQVSKVWEFEDDSDLGTGIALYKKFLITANTKGEVYALHEKNGKKAWQYQTQGKIYSTPAVYKSYVVVGSSDGFIYGLSADKGKLLWKVATQKAVLGSPVIADGIAYIGSSDHVFRAINVTNGELVWQYQDVEGFVVSRPLLYRDKVYFGSWGRHLYALDKHTGKEVWKWNNGSANRMYSPAACYPVASEGKIFIAAPDRFLTAFDAETGNVVWRHTNPENRPRESIGISQDSSIVYVKTMDGKVFGASTLGDEYRETWQSSLQLPYEISPTAITESGGLVFVPSHSGLVSALSRKDGEVIWQYKTSNSLVNTIQPIRAGQVVVSTMDGKITKLVYIQ